MLTSYTCIILCVLCMYIPLLESYVYSKIMLKRFHCKTYCSVEDTQGNRRLEESKKSVYTASYDNDISFFPRTLDELADDVNASIQLALISKLKRLRIDIRLQLTEKSRNMLQWLLLLSSKIIDDEIDNVHVFTNTLDRQKIDSFLPVDGEKKHITVISKVDIDELIKSNCKLFIVFNPDNVFDNTNPDIVGDLQSLCFHCSLRGIPVIIINPFLISNAWNSGGSRQPLLLSDFTNIYFICDDYFTILNNHKYLGLVQRAASGVDLFLLEGSSNIGIQRYQRVHSWSSVINSDVREIICRVLLTDPNFIVNRKDCPASLMSDKSIPVRQREAPSILSLDQIEQLH